MDKCKNWTEDCEMWDGCPCVDYESRKARVVKNIEEVEVGEVIMECNMSY